MSVIKKILCPIDFSSGSKAAVIWAQDWAQQFGAELYLVHAYENPVYVLPMAGYVGPTVDMLSGVRKHLDDELGRWKTEVEKSGLRVRADLIEGSPYRTVIDVARDYAPDLIVMGTHGRTGLAHALIGSVAERVVRLSPCPVLTVRATP
jgi:nucleotide-binding universal stress UspA family protein